MAKKVRSEKDPNKPIYKKWWFWVVIVLVIGAFGGGGSDEKKEADKETTKQSSTTIETVESTTASSTAPKEVTITLESPEVEADKDGNATIKGTTAPGANVSVGAGIIGDMVTADDQGNFELVHKLSNAQEEDLTINSNLDRKTASADVKVKPSQEMIDQEAKNKDITILSADPTDDQAITLQTLAEQQFDIEFPYKGSKIHSITGVIQPWTQNGDAWFYKVQATVVNGFGAEQDCVAEFKITPTGPDSGNVEITAY